MQTALIRFAKAHGYKATAYGDDAVAIIIPTYSAREGRGSITEIVSDWSSARAALGY